jgi:hypothetical protein
MAHGGRVGPQLLKHFFLHVVLKGTYLKDLFNENQWAHRAQIYIKVVRHGTNASLLKSSPLGVRWGYNKGQVLYL